MDNEKKVIVIDGMVVVQSMGKPQQVTNCSQWADHFIFLVESISEEFVEVHIVFDRDDLPMLLKNITRERRQSGKPPIVYRVTDATPLSKVTAKQFLSSTKT